MIMYVAFQDNAVWQVWRLDGLPFHAPTAGRKYGNAYTGNVYDSEFYALRTSRVFWMSNQPRPLLFKRGS
jgi:hypothetical protein